MARKGIICVAPSSKIIPRSCSSGRRLVVFLLGKNDFSSIFSDYEIQGHGREGNASHGSYYTATRKAKLIYFLSINCLGLSKWPLRTIFLCVIFAVAEQQACRSPVVLKPEGGVSNSSSLLA